MLFVARILYGLWGLVAPLLGTWVGRVLLSLGIGYATYSGVDTSITFAKNAFLSGVGGLPAAAIQIAGLLKIGVCVSMLTSALTARMVLAGMTSGSVKKMVIK